MPGGLLNLKTAIFAWSGPLSNLLSDSRNLQLRLLQPHFQMRAGMGLIFRRRTLKYKTRHSATKWGAWGLWVIKNRPSSGDRRIMDSFVDPRNTYRRGAMDASPRTRRFGVQIPLAPLNDAAVASTRGGFFSARTLEFAAGKSPGVRGTVRIVVRSLWQILGVLFLRAGRSSIAR